MGAFGQLLGSTEKCLPGLRRQGGLRGLERPGEGDCNAIDYYIIKVSVVPGKINEIPL